MRRCKYTDQMIVLGVHIGASLQGQSNEIFFTPVFSIIRLILVPVDMSGSDFEYHRIFVESFVLEIQIDSLLPAISDSGE